MKKKAKPDSLAMESPSYPHVPRREMLSFIPSTAQRVLDVGCHSGAFGEILKSQRSVEVWGIEPNIAAAERALPLLDRVIIAPFTEQSPVPDAYFDTIVFNDVLEHLVDPWAMIRLAVRKLRENGCIVASLPNSRHISNLLHIWSDKDFRYEVDGIRDRTHLRFFTRKSMVRLFEESGTKVIQIEGINAQWWTPSLTRRLVYRLLNQRLEDTKYIQYAIVARPNL